MGGKAMATLAASAALGLLFFTAQDFTHGRELWVSDGTTAGTHMVRNLTAGDADSNVAAIATVKGGVVFIAQTGGNTADLYFSDGTATNTKSIRAFPNQIVGNVGGYAYFTTLDLAVIPVYRRDAARNKGGCRDRYQYPEPLHYSPLQITDIDREASAARNLG